jgi:hypothetical protein
MALTVVESLSVMDKIDAECATYPRLEEAFDGLKWWLAHNPDSGELLDDYHWLYKQKGNREQHIPNLIVLYTFVPNVEVCLLSILIRIPTLS